MRLLLPSAFFSHFQAFFTARRDLLSHVGKATGILRGSGFVGILGLLSLFAPNLTEAQGSVMTLQETLAHAQSALAAGDQISLTNLDQFNCTYILGPKQITDIYLLGLASQSTAKLATFDGNIPIQAVNGATKANLEVIR